jgi:predicted nucleic acid-binding protein
MSLHSNIITGEGMKTKREIKEEIVELYGATKALAEVMEVLHAQRMEKLRQLMALNHMFNEMEDDDDTR